MAESKIIAEIKELNSEHLLTRIGYLYIFKDRVAFHEIHNIPYLRVGQPFEIEYPEVTETQAREEELKNTRKEMELKLEGKRSPLEEEAIEVDREIKAKRLEISRAVGIITEERVAPKYLEMLGFTAIHPHIRQNDPYDYVATRSGFFWFIDVKSQKSNAPKIFQIWEKFS